MSDRYTLRNRFTQPGYGAYPESWGEPVLNGVLELIDEACDGMVEIDVSAVGNASRPVHAVDGLGDEARCRVLRVTGSPTGPVTLLLPAVEKTALVLNETSSGFPIHIGCAEGGMSASLRWRERGWIACDGLGVQRITPAPTAPGLIDLAPLGLALGPPPFGLTLPMCSDAVLDADAPPRLVLGAPAPAEMVLRLSVLAVPLTVGDLTVPMGSRLSTPVPLLCDLGAVRQLPAGVGLSIAAVGDLPADFTGGLFLHLPLRAVEAAP